MDGVERVILDGWDSNDWMVVDMGHIVVHCLLEEKRQQLELEKLWTLGSELDDQLRESTKFDSTN